jgi:hypothetical protein
MGTVMTKEPPFDINRPPFDLTKPVSVDDLLAWREQDPAYHEMLRRQAEQVARGEASYRKAANPVLNDLARIGYPVDRIVELPLFYGRYLEAVPLLLAWLKRTPWAGIKEEIARALTVRWVGPEVGEALVEEFRAAPKEGGLRWAIGNALCEAGKEDILEDMLAIAGNRDYGRSRQMVVNGLGRFMREDVEYLLLSLLDDDDVVGHAVYALGCLKREHLRTTFEKLLDHPRVLVRREARGALKKLDRWLARQQPLERS